MASGSLLLSQNCLTFARCKSLQFNFAKLGKIETFGIRR